MNGSTLRKLIAWIKDGDSAYFNGDIAIGHNNPAARLHIKGKGDTSDTSALKVENSAGSILLNILNNGKIGVNKATPTYDMDIVGDLNFTGNLLKNGAAYNPGSQWQNNGSNIYFNSGNVGINTTNPLARLQINNQAAFNTTTPGPAAYYGLHFDGQSTADYATGITWNGGTSGTQAGIYVQGSGGYGSKMYFATTNSYAIGAQNRMIIDHTGNVGIGTTTPIGKLDVNGNVIIRSSSGLTMYDSAGGGGGGIYSSYNYTNGEVFIKPLGSSNPTVFSPNGGMIIGAQSSAPPANGLLVSGNVGIGITNPAQKLDVAGTSNFRDSMLFNGFGRITWDTPGFVIRADGSYKLNLGGGGRNTDLTIDTAGNVGIGITTPTAKLDINSDILRLRTAKTPDTAGASGNAGDICWDSSYFYICVATNTWKRSAIATW